MSVDPECDDTDPVEDRTQVDRQALAFAAAALARAQELARSQGHLRTRLPRRRAASFFTDTQPLADDVEVDTPATASSPTELRRLGLQADTDGDLVAVSKVAATAGSAYRAQHGMARTRLSYRAPKPLFASVEGLIRARGWQGSTRMGTVMARWETIVGPDVARHCGVETFDGGVLIVRCSSTAWTKQLQLLLPTIERRIDEVVGPGVVSQVVVRGPVAPSWKKGPYSVPGRGPRDTYG